MNIRDLEYLVAVADLKHFRKAAERCCVSQPTLSGQLKKLEEELGVQLIERTKHKVFLTPLGEEIARQADRVLTKAAHIMDLAKTGKDPFAGPMKLGVFPTLGPYLLPYIVHPIQKEFPKLNLYLVEEQTRRILQMVKDGKLDAVILALPELHEELEVHELFEEPFCLAVPPKHTFAKRKKIMQTDLKGEALLLLEDGHCLRNNALDVCAYAGAREQLGFRASSLETLRQMVSVGTGITLIPDLAVKRDLSDPHSIRYIPFSDPVPGRKIGILWRKSSLRKSCLVKIADIIIQETRKVLS
ncbi:DNA-binding transcriptional regulator OxyR [Fibrobacterota bacterium]